MELIADLDMKKGIFTYLTDLETMLEKARGRPSSEEKA